MDSWYFGISCPKRMLRVGSNETGPHVVTGSPFPGWQNLGFGTIPHTRASLCASSGIWGERGSWQTLHGVLRCHHPARGKNCTVAREGLVLRDVKVFYRYSESLLLILNSWMQLFISRSPSTL